MDLLEQTVQLCKMYNIKPARSRGQNFLIREEVYDKAVAMADLQTTDTVLEVGPGLGFLTAKLAVGANGRSPVQKVIAVELDDKLASVLKIGLMAKNIKNVEVVNEDILQLTIKNYLPTLPAGRQAGQAGELRNYKIVANLPYNITSIFLRKFLEAEIKPELMVLMLQKEVAERITARPGQMSLLSVSVQFYAKAEIMDIVPKEFFWPKPEVDSAIVKITPLPLPQPLPRSFFAGEGRKNLPSPLLEGGKTEKDFFRLVKFGFSAKRKMLKNNLAVGFKMDQAVAEEKIKQAGLNPKIRAQELSIDDWLRLFSVFNKDMV